MKRNLTLILAGLLAFGVQGQENQKTSKKEIDEKRRATIVAASNYYKSAAEGYLEAANNKTEMVSNYQELAAPIRKRIDSNTETNYPAAWIKFATYLKLAGTLEKQVAINLLRAGASLEKAYEVHLELGQKMTSFLHKRDSLDYQKHETNSRQYYETSKKYFEAAGDKPNSTAVIELMALEDEVTGDFYKSLTK